MNHFEEQYTVDSIREYIKKELGGQNVPQRATVEKWLKEFGQDRIKERIDVHISYWKTLANTKTEPFSSTSQNLEPDSSLVSALSSNKTINELIEEGYQGVDWKLIEELDFVNATYRFKDKIQWTKTKPDKDGNVALMTPNLSEFDNLLEFMLNRFGWCPQAYLKEEEDKVFIFTPKNELEEKAIALAIEGDYGWKGSLYSLDYTGVSENQNYLCSIFATQPQDSQEQEWLLWRLDLEEKSSSWSVHTGTLEEVYYIWGEEIGIPIPKFKQTGDEILNALNTYHFPTIIKDFLSTEYPDCIRDIFGDNYGFISEKRLVEHWQGVQANGNEYLFIEVATGWVSFIEEVFPKELANQKLTKIEIFNQLNLPLLTECKLVFSSNLGFSFHRKGQQLTTDKTEDWQITSEVSYEIIRILTVEIIWQARAIL